ncbi:MAG: hypothetical protein D6784_16980, partial [Chloroflexi bacterium]
DGARQVWQAGEVLAAGYRLELDALPGERYHLDVALLPAGAAEPVGDSVRIEDVQDKIVVRVNR